VLVLFFVGFFCVCVCVCFLIVRFFFCRLSHGGPHDYQDCLECKIVGTTCLTAAGMTCHPLACQTCLPFFEILFNSISRLFFFFSRAGRRVPAEHGQEATSRGEAGHCGVSNSRHR
jgi:hypothetical protein